MSENSKDDGWPAFPIPLNQGESWNYETGGSPNGMSLRDWFAGIALQAIVSKAPYRTGFVTDDHDENPIARGAYCYADAMLQARKG